MLITLMFRILGPIKFCKEPIKISNRPLKFGNLHVFEWDMGHWSIFRAHHHFGLGLSLPVKLSISFRPNFHLPSYICVCKREGSVGGSEPLLVSYAINSIILQAYLQCKKTPDCRMRTKAQTSLHIYAV